MMPLTSSNAPRLTWRRVLVHVVVAVGILAMHQAISADVTEAHDHGHAATVPAAHHADAGAMTANSMPAGGDHGSMLMDCCQALMTCLAMLAGLGALALLAGPRATGILRQLRTTLRVAMPPPVHGVGLSIRQRTTILRC